MPRLRLFWILLPGLFCATSPASPIVLVGSHNLLPELPDQSIEIYVAGGDLVQGLNFRIQVEDGGPHPPVTGLVPGPRITAVDLVSQTIFSTNNNGQLDVLRSPQIWVQSITTSPATVPNDQVPAEGLLATVTFDTTGFSVGVYALMMSSTLDGPTDFAGVPIDISDGSLRIIPEPGWQIVFWSGWAGWLAYQLTTGRSRRVIRHGMKPCGALRETQPAVAR